MSNEAGDVNGGILTIGQDIAVLLRHEKLTAHREELVYSGDNTSKHESKKPPEINCSVTSHGGRKVNEYTCE